MIWKEIGRVLDFSSADSFIWILPPPGVSNWSISGIPFTIFMGPFSLFALSHLPSKNQIPLHLVQNDLAVLFPCFLWFHVPIHDFSSLCLHQIAYWDVFPIKGSSFPKIMPLKSHYNSFIHSSIHQIFEMCAMLDTMSGMANTEVKKMMGFFILKN